MQQLKGITPIYSGNLFEEITEAALTANTKEHPDPRDPTHWVWGLTPVVVGGRSYTVIRDVAQRIETVVLQNYVTFEQLERAGWTTTLSRVPEYNDYSGMLHDAWPGE